MSTVRVRVEQAVPGVDRLAGRAARARCASRGSGRRPAPSPCAGSTRAPRASAGRSAGTRPSRRCRSPRGRRAPGSRRSRRRPRCSRQLACVRTESVKRARAQPERRRPAQEVDRRRSCRARRGRWRVERQEDPHVVPCAARGARDRPATTSPRPPVLANGVTSAATWQIRSESAEAMPSDHRARAGARRSWARR